MANVTVEQAAINHESLSTISPMLSDRNGDLRQTGEKRITSQEEKSTCNDNPGLKDLKRATRTILRTGLSGENGRLYSLLPRCTCLRK